jgi:hypothetical protein
MDLILKEVSSTHVDMNCDGYICIEQKSAQTGEFTYVRLTLEQFRSIDKWVEKNYLDLVGAWNGGAEDGKS